MLFGRIKAHSLLKSKCFAVTYCLFLYFYYIFFKNDIIYCHLVPYVCSFPQYFILRCCIMICREDFKTLSNIYKSTRSEVFCKKGVLRNLTKFTGKHLCQSLFFKHKIIISILYLTVFWILTRFTYKRICEKHG